MQDESEMYGRKEEMCYLMKLYNSETFEFPVIFNRRRVGKPTILQEFGCEKTASFLRLFPELLFK